MFLRVKKIKPGAFNPDLPRVKHGPTLPGKGVRGSSPQVDERAGYAGGGVERGCQPRRHLLRNVQQVLGVGAQVAIGRFRYIA